MALSDYPKETNRLLTQQEKCFLDTLPEEALSTFFNESEGKATGRITGIMDSGVMTLILETPDRIQAVKDYIEMIRQISDPE
jgi:hypothetical protein